MSVYDDIKAERDHQVERWGTRTDLEINEPNDFVSYIAHYSTKWFNGDFAPYPTSVVDEYRHRMIQVAAIAVAAVETLDQQRRIDTRAHFEE